MLEHACPRRTTMWVCVRVRALSACVVFGEKRVSSVFLSVQPSPRGGRWMAGEVKG